MKGDVRKVGTRDLYTSVLSRRMTFTQASMRWVARVVVMHHNLQKKPKAKFRRALRIRRTRPKESDPKEYAEMGAIINEESAVPR